MTQIDELTIRVPGGGSEEGNQALGREVAQRVAAALPEGTGGKRIPALSIRLTAPPGMGTTALADAIAEQIVRQIRQLIF
ncbi:MAG: hypothetical protein ICV83_05410 [Cytophagales bacterium]|nr:hypothetical protein [Cytophagales bacterium]